MCSVFVTQNGLQKKTACTSEYNGKGGGDVECVYMRVCAGKRERERERGESKNGDIFLPSFFMPVVKQCHSSHKQAAKRSSVASDVHVPPFGKPALFAVWLLCGAPTLAHEDNRLAAFWIVQRWSEENPSLGSNFSQIGYYLLFRQLMGS